MKTKVFGDCVTQLKMSQTSGGIAIYWVSAFLVDDLLIDTGCSHTKEELLFTLKERHLRKVVNTHYHEDHVGGNHLLQSTRQVRICAHTLAVPLLKKKPKLYPFQEMAWGTPDPSEAEPIEEIVESASHEFQVVYVPGHTRDHIALFERKERWAFLGDAFVRVRPVATRLEEDQWEIISSLKRIRAFAPRLIFPSEGDPITDPSFVLEQAISVREELGQRILKLSKEGMNPAQIMMRVFGKEAEFDKMGLAGTYKEYTQGQFSTENLVRTFLKDLN